MNRWRPSPTFLLTAYGPTLLASMGIGAITPLVALTARDLGSGVGVAAFVVALLGIGQLCGDLPAGVLADRLGEKRALVLACLLEAASLAVACVAPDVVVLGAAVFAAGVASSVLGLARQSYFTVAVPAAYRARALSGLGGSLRMGFLVGPLVGAGLIAAFDLWAAYAFAALMSLFAGLVTLALPDLPSTGRPSGPAPRVALREVLWQHRRVLATVGVGSLLIMMVRASRQSIIPLWADSQGVDPAVTSIIFGISGAMDMLMFFPGGWIMDRFGRLWVAAPATAVIGVGMLLLPLTSTVVTIAAVALLMGLGNGISSGVVMTMGSDASPAVGRSQFLSGWRLFADAGTSLGPLLITLVAGLASLGAASLTVGALALLGTGWLVRWVPRRRRPAG
ncbi:MFS transporter [Desertihabitans brevis]|nr:MFS transporter [Desertihabitans brevis]